MPQLVGVPAFVCVAEQRGFRAAASLLGVTPTAVSKAIARLEAQLGVQLLLRTSRHVSLTPEGEVYFVHCREALDRLQAGEDLLTRASQVAQGTVKVSASFALGGVLVQGLKRLVSRHPRIRVHLTFSDREVGLVEEEVDVAVRIGTLPDSALVAHRLRTPRWATVAAPTYLAQAGPLPTPAALANHRLVAFVRPTGGLVPWSFQGPAGPVSVVPEASLVLNDGERLVEAAAAGLGVAQVFDFMVADRLRRGELIEVLADWSAPGPAIHALTLPGRNKVPRVRAFLTFLDEVLPV